MVEADASMTMLQIVFGAVGSVIFGSITIGSFLILQAFEESEKTAATRIMLSDQCQTAMKRFAITAVLFGLICILALWRLQTDQVMAGQLIRLGSTILFGGYAYLIGTMVYTVRK